MADENGKFCSEKGKISEISRKSKKISKIGGKSETGGNASWPQGGWTPLWTKWGDKIVRTKW